MALLRNISEVINPGNPPVTIPTVNTPTTNPNKKRTVYFPIANKRYDDNLKIEDNWNERVKKAKDINELDNSVIGTWENKPLMMKDFLGFPEHVKNFYKPHHAYEFQKNKLGIENNYNELNMNPSPATPMYTPSRSAKNAGNDVAYVGEESPEIIKQDEIVESSILSNISKIK